MKDTIYREDALDATRKLTSIVGGSYISKGDMQSVLMQLPSAEPKTGEWFYTEHYGERYRVCSSCGAERVDDRSTGWNFCPDCGSYNGRMT